MAGPYWDPWMHTSAYPAEQAKPDCLAARVQEVGLGGWQQVCPGCARYALSHCPELPCMLAGTDRTAGVYMCCCMSPGLMPCTPVHARTPGRLVAQTCSCRRRDAWGFLCIPGRFDPCVRRMRAWKARYRLTQECSPVACRNTLHSRAASCCMTAKAASCSRDARA